MPVLAQITCLLLLVLLGACGAANNQTGTAATTMAVRAARTAAPTVQAPDMAATTTSNATSGKPIVIATTTQLDDVVGVIAGDQVVVVGLVPRNGDPHEFEPTPNDVKRVATAQAVFKNGVGLEGWLDKLLTNAGGQRPIFDMSHGLTLGTVDHSVAGGGETDPHIWMSPLNMLTVVDNVVSGLKQVDPTGAATFDANAAEYKNKLTELDAYAEKTLAVIPAERRKLVTDHDTMGYFAARYKFDILGAVVPSVSTEAAETSAKQLKELVNKIRAAQVPAIFTEPSVNPKFIEQVGAEAKVNVVTDLYGDSLGDKGGEAGTYLDFFRSDVEKIAKALK